MKKEEFINPFIHLLQSNDEDSLFCIVLFIALVLIQQNETGMMQQQNELYRFMGKNGSLTRLLQIIQDDSIQREDVKQFSTLIIASLYKAIQLPDKFRGSIIDLLKQMSNGDDVEVVHLSILVLSRIAECKDNHTDITSGDFENALRNYIQSDNPQTVDQAFCNVPYASDLWGGLFDVAKNSVKLEQSEPGLFLNFDLPKFTTKTPVATAVEQPEMGDQIGIFLQYELQSTLQDTERQLKPRQAVIERTQALMAKVLEAMIGIQASEIDFYATNILDEQNGEARRREIQCPSLLLITSVPVPDEVLDSKRSPIDKILQSEHALALYNFRIDEGMLAHL
ncbi:MAG: hypothetical protein EZS28_038333, partial [Streblomastix strix]